MHWLIFSGAVEAKMQAEGVDSSVLDLNPNKPLPPDLQIKQTASSEASKNAAAAALEGPPYYEAILPALLTLAPALTPERLAAVADMWPTDTEGKRLLGFRGSASQLSSDGERFMLWAARCGVARAKTKVEAALVVSSFEGARQRLAEDVACLAHAALRVMGSTRLQRILEILLVVGNAMNADARDEIANARGFTVESLLKLCDTKAASSRFKGTTLLDFFVSMVLLIETCKYVCIDTLEWVLLSFDRYKDIIHGTLISCCNFLRGVRCNFHSILF